MAPHESTMEAAAEQPMEKNLPAPVIASYRWGWADIVLYTALLAYCLITCFHWNEGYIDFGDGNYLYISWRLTQGAVLYRDILAPQPPMHFLTGWILAKTAAALNLAVLYTFRTFSVVLHIVTALLAARLASFFARHFFSPQPSRWIRTFAGITYLLLPIGFWWSSGYQSEPLEIVFLYGALLALLEGNTPKTAVVGGILAALATLTNMTAAPYAGLFLFYLGIRERRSFAPFVASFLAVWGATTGVLEWKTGAYLENVIFNQVGSFPRREFLPPGENLFTYAWRKITNEGRDILNLESGYIILALIGLYLFLRKGARAGREELAGWSVLGFMASIVYVAKGGTMDYIFTIGEPAVAALAAVAIAAIVVWAGEGCASEMAEGKRWNTIPLLHVLTAIAAVIVVGGPGLGFIWRTLKQETYELDEYHTRQVIELIRQHTNESDEILAPPFYAFLAKRRIVADYSEIFLWTLKYYNEKQDRTHGRGIETVEQIAKALREKKIKFVALDLDQTGKIPEIRDAIAAGYEPLRQSEFRTLNTRLLFYVPRNQSSTP